MSEHTPFGMKNECHKHGLLFDLDDCPRCSREKYEADFKANVYKNAEERHRNYISELKNTIGCQREENAKLIADNKRLREALSKMVGTAQPMNDMQWRAYNESKQALNESE